MLVPTYVHAAHFMGVMKCTIYIHICWYQHVVHFVGVMKCTVEAFKTCSNQGLTPTYLQKVGSILMDLEVTKVLSKDDTSAELLNHVLLSES